MSNSFWGGTKREKSHLKKVSWLVAYLLTYLVRGLVQTICGKISVIVMMGGEGGCVLDVKPSSYIAKALIATFLSSLRDARGRGGGG